MASEEDPEEKSRWKSLHAGIPYEMVEARDIEIEEGGDITVSFNGQDIECEIEELYEEDEYDYYSFLLKVKDDE